MTIVTTFGLQELRLCDTISMLGKGIERTERTESLTPVIMGTYAKPLRVQVCVRPHVVDYYCGILVLFIVLLPLCLVHTSRWDFLSTRYSVRS